MEGPRGRGNGITMKLWVRLAQAYVLSLVLCGALQQAMLIVTGEKIILDMLPHLGGCIAAITLLFAVVEGFGRKGVDWAAALLLVAMLAFGVALYHTGVNSRTPGVGGTVFHGVAMLVVFYFLIPSALAVPIHWRLLRRAPAA